MSQSIGEIFEIAMGAYRGGDLAGANAVLEQICLRDPKYAQAYALRGGIAFDQGRNLDAVVYFERAASLEPDANICNNMGAALVELKQFSRAERCFQQALELNPLFDRALANLGHLYLIHGQLREAREVCQKAIELNHDCIQAHVRLGLIALKQGDLKTGWTEFEWRRRLTESRRNKSIKEWDYRRLRFSDAILLYGEEGFGDTIQFCRFGPLIKKRFGCRVYLEARSPLYRLLQTLEGIDGVICYGDAVPVKVNTVASMLSVARFFCPSLDDIPSTGSYLSASPSRVETFDRFFEGLPKDIAKVGICWAGNAGMTRDKRRSTQLTQWEPVAQVPGIALVPLQKGPAAKEMVNPAALGAINECDDFADTAALLMQCDLVISVDTSVAHLAAALGKPTWVLSHYDSDWRWLVDRRDSPWYPSVRHYRQKTFDDWPGLFNEVAADLQTWLVGWQACQKL